MSVIKKNLIISDHNHTGNAHVKSSFPHTFADKLIKSTEPIL